MYPVCLNLSGKLSVVVGGGRVAERKVFGILADSGEVRVVSPILTERLRALATQGVVDWRERPYCAADLSGAFLVFATTDLPDVQNAVYEDARAAGVLVNMADAPGLCDFQVPSIIRRGDLTLSVSTNGKSPAVSAMIRRRLEHDFGEEYGDLVALMATLRERILMEEQGDYDAKKTLFQQILHENMVEWLKTCRWDMIQQHLQSVLGRSLDIDLKALTREVS